MSLVDQVKLNLVHYNLWTDVEILTGSSSLVTVLCGIPPKPLSAASQVIPNYSNNPTEDNTDIQSPKEWVFPVLKDEKLTMQTVDKIFGEISSLNDQSRPKRILVAIVDIDGTVTYYFIHDGIAKPRQS